MPFTYQGLRHYVERAAREMDLNPSRSVLPTSQAIRSQVLKMIENQVCGAQHASDPKDRAEILAHVEDYLETLEITIRAGVDMARDGYTSAGLEIPGWLERFSTKAFAFCENIDELIDEDDDIFSPLAPEECILCTDEDVSVDPKPDGRSKK